MSERFELPAELTIYNVDPIRTDLLAWAAQLEGSAPAVISAGKVDAVDGAGLQLLAALGNMGVSWRLTDSSTPFSEACRTLGMAHWLESTEQGAST